MTWLSRALIGILLIGLLEAVGAAVYVAYRALW